MAREETFGPASHPSKIHAQPFHGEPDADTAAPAVLVIAPPSRVLYLNQRARMLLAETLQVQDKTDPEIRSGPDTVLRAIQRLAARMFRAGDHSDGGDTPLEINGLNHSIGSHLRVHGLLLHDAGDVHYRRAIVMFERVSPSH